GPGLRVDILVVRVGNDGQRLEDLALDEQLVASGHVLDQQVLTWWVDVPGGPGDLVALDMESVDPLDHRGVDEDREERNRGAGLLLDPAGPVMDVLLSGFERCCG